MQQSQLLDDLHVRIDEQEVLQWLRIRPNSPAVPHVSSLLERVRAATRPRALYRECSIDRHESDGIWIEGLKFSSPALAVLLGSSDRVIAYVVTCGRELDAVVPQDGSSLEKLALDTIGNLILQASCQEMEQRIAERHGFGMTGRIGPGAGDGELWPIEQQAELFGLLGDTASTIGVELTKDHLMLPIKSFSGFLFATEDDFSACQLCQSQECPMRESAFSPALRSALAQGKPADESPSPIKTP